MGQKKEKIKVLLINITWNNLGWKGVSNDKSSHRYVSDGNVPYESWNFDFENSRNPKDKILGYAQFTNAPKVIGDNNLIFFYSDGKIVGIYGKAEVFNPAKSINTNERYNLMGDSGYSLLLENKIDNIKEKGFLDGKERIGQIGFNYIKTTDVVLNILDTAIELNPEEIKKLQQIREWYEGSIEDDTDIEKEPKINKMLNRELPLNQILFGPPGTGKTYNVINLAISIINPDFDITQERFIIKSEFERLAYENQIDFVTFHQSFSYEDFVEGIKPSLNKNNDVIYEIHDGVFKKNCLKARKNPNKKFVLIIDEINRGNIASIFGELITLIEEDKRQYNKEALSTTLPYSKKSFSVPNNVYILGTMNTADRSIEALDIALRRRFSFIEMAPDREKVTGFVDGIDIQQIFEVINQRIEKLLDKDHKIGHAYFLNIKSKDDLKKVFKDKIIPLLEEYFFGDYAKIGLILGNSFVKHIENDSRFTFAKFNHSDISDLSEKPIYEIGNWNDWDFNSILNNGNNQ